VLAFALPVLTALALIPFRAEHGRTTAIVLVVPVVLVSSLGATGPALAAAVVGGVAFVVVLTAPFQCLAIGDPVDIVAAATLVLVGLIVGWLSSRLTRLRAQTAGRSDELTHVVSFALDAADATDAQPLIDAAAVHLTAVLDLADCHWERSAAADGRPVLLADGGIMGYLHDLNPDRGVLPPGTVLPVAVDASPPFGRFILEPRPGSITSVEERHTAAAVAQMLAAALHRIG
jgi:hypothetical protein